jgi:hypothetical protein
MVDSVTDIANNTTTAAADRYVALSIVLTSYIELMTFSAPDNTLEISSIVLLKM